MASEAKRPQLIRSSDFLTAILAEGYRHEYTEYHRKNLRMSDAGAAAPLGEPCERQIVYDLAERDRAAADEQPLKTALASGSLAFFADGRLFEEDIRRRLRTVLRSPERELTDEALGARGRIDNQVYIHAVKSLIKDHDLPLTHDPMLEIKTVNEFQFSMMARTGQVLQKYYDQVQQYLYVLGQPWGILLIKNRNGFGPSPGTLPFLEYVILADPVRQEQIRAGLKWTKSAYAQAKKAGENQVPRPFKRDSSTCGFCRFKRDCWGDEPFNRPSLSTVPTDKPSQELLESAVKTAYDADQQIEALKLQATEAKEVILRYLAGSDTPEVMVGNLRAVTYRSSKRTLDAPFLLETLGLEQYAKLSSPDRGLLETAVKDRELDAGVLEEAMKVEYADPAVRITDKTVPTKRVSQPKTRAPRRRLTKQEKRKVAKAKGKK